MASGHSIKWKDYVLNSSFSCYDRFFLNGYPYFLSNGPSSYFSPSHVPIVPFHSFLTKVSASHLIIYQNTTSQSVCPSVHVGCHSHNRMSRHTPPPHLWCLLMIGWLSALLLVWRSGWRCFSWLNYGTKRRGTPCWWRDAKWNRWAEIEHCQERLIIRNLFPKQTYCNQITYCNHRCIVLLVLWRFGDNGLDQLTDDGRDWISSWTGAAAVSFF